MLYKPRWICPRNLGDLRGICLLLSSEDTEESKEEDIIHIFAGLTSSGSTSLTAPDVEDVDGEPMNLSPGAFAIFSTFSIFSIFSTLSA